MNKGTIIYIGGFELPDKNAAAHRVYNNSLILESLGYKVVFIGVDKTISFDDYAGTHVGPFINYPKKYPSSLLDWVKSSFSFKHTKCIFELYSDVVAVILYNPHSSLLSKTIKYCRNKRIAVISDITEWYEYHFSFNPIKLIKWLDNNRAMRVLNKRVDGIIAISSFLENYYKNSVKKIIRMPPLVDTQNSIWNQNIVNKQKEGTTFTYTGVPGKEKDRLDLIIKALSDSEICSFDFSFSFVGITKDEFLRDYPKLSDCLFSLKEKVSFMGRLQHKESVSELLASDYTVIVRDQTRKNNAGFPTKFVEAVTCGTKIVANNFSDISSYNSKDIMIMLEDLSIDSFKKAFLLCLQIGKSSHKHIEMFDYRRHTNEFNTFIKGCLNKYN